jgi:tRNA(Arg) A34 adenosine deaminase TadA
VSDTPTNLSPMPEFTERDERAMVRALELAGIAAGFGEVPVGAVVYRTADGEILGEGFNRREIDSDPLAHAETIAIAAAAKKLGDWRLTDYTLVVTLEPCCMCAGAIVHARLGRLIYGATDPKAGACNSLHALTTDARLNHRVTPQAGLMATECGEVLRTFFKRLRSRSEPQVPVPGK